MNIKELLGKRIKELRIQNGYTQEKLAEIIGIEPNNLSRIEKGRNYPSSENIVKIANSLNVSIDKLYIFSHHKSYSEIKDELINALNDETFGRMLYKFYRLIKE